MYGQPPGYEEKGPRRGGEVRLSGIRDGYRGTSDVVAAMRELAIGAAPDEEVNRLARRIIDACESHDSACEVRSIHEFIRAGGGGGFRYNKLQIGRDLQRLQTPRETLFDAPTRAGECASLSVAEAALLMSVGYKPRFVTVGTDPANPSFFEHVFVRVYVPGAGWVAADPSFARPLGWEDPRGVSGEEWDVA